MPLRANKSGGDAEEAEGAEKRGVAEVIAAAVPSPLPPPPAHPFPLVASTEEGVR